MHEFTVCSVVIGLELLWREALLAYPVVTFSL